MKAGKPNAGKSTLLNALLNEEKAIVSDIPGTTRDVIEDVINVDGIAVRFTDTAGIRTTEDKVEAIGVERTMSKMKAASVVLYLDRHERRSAGRRGQGNRFHQRPGRSLPADRQQAGSGETSCTKATGRQQCLANLSVVKSKTWKTSRRHLKNWYLWTTSSLETPSSPTYGTMRV